MYHVQTYRAKVRELKSPVLVTKQIIHEVTIVRTSMVKGRYIC
jgi:hypothetical protein